MPLGSSEQKPGVLLNIIRYTGQLLTIKNYPFLNVNCVEVEELCIMEIINLLTHVTLTAKS